MNPQDPYGNGQNPQYQPAPQPMPQPQNVQQAYPQPAVPGYATMPQQATPVAAPRIYGKVSKAWLITAIIFIVVAIGASAAFVWAYLNYVDNRDNVDAKVSTAINETRLETERVKEENFLQREKEPNRFFTGPEDYGGVSFKYPKTWSVYVAKDASSGGVYETYFNPVTVPTVSSTQQYGLRMLIEEKDYDKVLDTYKRLVDKGDLKLTAVKIDGTDGTRLDGAFTKDIVGAAVIFKIRDKTVTLRTDAKTFIEPDFNALIKTITFNK